MKILVTGGTGFIGSFVVEALVSENHDVIIIANGRQLPPYLNAVRDHISYFQGDYGETDLLRKVLPVCDAVVHLAWSTVPKQAMEGTSFEFTSNIISTIALIERCIEYKVKNIVFMSSGGTVYGLPTVIPIPETHKVDPISAYGLGKATTEKLLRLYHHAQKMNHVILRVSNAYGERQNLYKNQGVIGIWLSNILQKKAIDVWGDGSVIRDYVYVQDVVGAIMKSLKVDGAFTYNIGAGQGYSLNEIVGEIRNVVNVAFDINYRPARNFDVPENILDISKAQNELDYFPKISLQEGIHRTWEWFANNKES